MSNWVLQKEPLICHILCTFLGHLKRIEKDQTNFGIDSAIRYVGYLEHHIVLEPFFLDKSYHIYKYNDLITWMKESRRCKQTHYTQRTLAKVLECSYVNIAKIESKKHYECRYLYTIAGYISNRH